MLLNLFMGHVLYWNQELSSCIPQLDLFSFLNMHTKTLLCDYFLTLTL